MDRKVIQEEGMLTRYIAGELNREERAAVDKILKTDKELRKQFDALEADFERIALENAIAPPDHVKTTILHALPKVQDSDSNKSTVIPIRQENTKRLALMVAASLAAVFLLSSAWLYNRWQNAEENLQRFEIQTAEMQERVTRLENSLSSTQKWYNAINQPDVLQFVLNGNTILPKSKAIAYVNHEEKRVIVNPQGLPKLSSDKTYQMWADVDHVMVNMGVIDTDAEMIDLTYIEKAHSLNITIEPAGGNDHPTVEQLISNVIL